MLSFESTVHRERWKGYVNKKMILKLVQALRYILSDDDNFFFFVSLIKHTDMVGSFIQLMNLGGM